MLKIPKCQNDFNNIFFIKYVWILKAILLLAVHFDMWKKFLFIYVYESKVIKQKKMKKSKASKSAFPSILNEFEIDLWLLNHHSSKYF